MEKDKLRIGDILKVWQGDDIHYERIIQLIPEILTEDMPMNEDSEISIQGIADNLKYELISNFKLSKVLHTYLPESIAFAIADRFYGSDYPMAQSTFDDAVKDLNYHGF